MFSACDMKEDYTKLGSVDKRVTAKLGEYQDVLCTAPYGWLADIYTGTGGTHRLWMSFSANEEVTMYTDYVEYYRTLRTTPYTSTYKLKAQQMPTLSFDTYSYLSIFADPNPLANGAGKPGVGMVADFEYEILSYKKGQIELIGCKNGMKALLTEATAEDYQAVSIGGLMDCVDLAPLYDQQFLTFSYEGQRYELVSNGRKTSLSWIENREPTAIIRNSQNDFEGNIILEEPILLGDQQITRFNKTASGYSVTIGNQLIDILKTTTTPASYLGYRNSDLTNVLYMFTSAQTEWNSEFYLIMQTMMTSLYNSETIPLYVAYVNVMLYTNPVAWVEVGYYMVNSSGGIDTSNTYSVIYEYALKANLDGSYAFGNSYTNHYGESDLISNHVKKSATGLLDGYFKGRTFFFKAWPKFYNNKYPYVALVPTEGADKTGVMVGFAYFE